MTEITWDDRGSRLYEVGLDRGVLYLVSGAAVAWNGLVSVSESLVGASQTPLYFNGQKYSDFLIPGDFAATMNAVTYPDELLELEGYGNSGTGLFVASQRAKRFGLSYRTLIGDDIEGLDFAYKIHILYNVVATVQNPRYQTLSDSNTPSEFSWSLSASPKPILGFRPSAHVVVDSRHVDPEVLADLERLLYGTAYSLPRQLTPTQLLSYLERTPTGISIIDHGDGTWSAAGPSTDITMTDATTFQIDNANSTVVDADTYTISST